MSVGFQFTAILPNQEDFLETLKGLSQQHDYSFVHGDDWARVTLCRMGDFYFNFEKSEDSSSHCIALEAECITSLSGPGFHAAAIDFTDELVAAAALHLEMDDETDYYSHRNFELMRREHFYSWLLTLVDVCRQECEETSLSNFCVCWDVNNYVPDDIPNTVVTPLGRFHINKLVDQVQNEGIEAFAEEFFIWNERQRDSRFYLNSAFSILWEDCYFRPGSRSETDLIANQSFLWNLEHAAILDTSHSLPMPKAEYELICRLENHTPMDLSDFPSYKPDYPAGYRRGKVVYRVGNTDLTLPGSFLQEAEENSTTLWYDGETDNWRNLRLSAIRTSGKAAKFSSSLFSDCEEAFKEFRTGDGKCRAAFAGEVQDEDGSVYYQSIAEIICAKQTTLITISYQQRKDADWAMNLIQEVKSYRKVVD